MIQESNRLEYLIPKKTSLRHRLPMADQGFIEFVAYLLEVNPKKRPSASEALKHPWLSFPYEPISSWGILLLDRGWLNICLDTWAPWNFDRSRFNTFYHDGAMASTKVQKANPYMVWSCLGATIRRSYVPCRPVLSQHALCCACNITLVFFFGLFLAPDVTGHFGLGTLERISRNRAVMLYMVWSLLNPVRPCHAVHLCYGSNPSSERLSGCLGICLSKLFCEAYKVCLSFLIAIKNWSTGSVCSY